MYSHKLITANGFDLLRNYFCCNHYYASDKRLIIRTVDHANISDYRCRATRFMPAKMSHNSERL